MSPDSVTPSRQRRAWRTMACIGCLLGATSILLTAVKWNGTDTRQDRQARTAQQAICAIVSYAEIQADTIRRGIPAHDGQPARPGNPRAAAGLDKLALDMRRTGITCPPRRHKQD